MELKSRIKTGVALAVIGIVLLALSDVPYIPETICALISAAGTYELLRSVHSNTPINVLLLGGIAILSQFVPIKNYYGLCLAFFIIFILVFAVMMKRIGTFQLNSPYEIFPFVLMVSVFARSMKELRRIDCGFYYLIFTVADCVVTDVAAYFVGKGFGKTKIAPRVSPGKTVEGCVGGVVASVLILTLAATALASKHDIKINYILLISFLLSASCIGQFGDLSMSVIKRSTGIKDFGNLLPGHGGILDRFDRLLFAAPFLYLEFSKITIFIGN